jgi:hypothetical protein
MNIPPAIRDAIERAVSTAAQTAIGVIGVDAVGITDVSWTGVASAAGLAAALSVLKTLAALKANGTTSLAIRSPEKTTRGEHVAD